MVKGQQASWTIALGGQKMLTRRMVLALIGLWFFFFGWLVNPAHSLEYQWMTLIFGGFIVLGNAWAWWDEMNGEWRDTVMALVGLYLALTPFFYGFSAFVVATWMSMVGGTVVVLGSLWNLNG